MEKKGVGKIAGQQVVVPYSKKSWSKGCDGRGTGELRHSQGVSLESVARNQKERFQWKERGKPV